MNSAPISPGISAIFSALLTNHDPESVGQRQPDAASGIDFGEILNNQQDAGKLMQRLETLLPPQDFERLKLALEDGKSLPQAVTIAVGQAADSGYWKTESPSPVAFTLQQSPFDMGDPQPLENNPFTGSPDSTPVRAGPGPVFGQPPFDAGEPQPSKNNPFTGSPDNTPVSAGPGPVFGQPRFHTGEPQPSKYNPFTGSPDNTPVRAGPGPVVGQPPFHTGEPQPLNNNPIAGSPKSVSVGAAATAGPSPDPFMQQARAPVPVDGIRMLTTPNEGIEGKPTAAQQPVIKLPLSTVVGPSDPLQSTPASSKKPGHTMNVDADDASRIPVARGMLRPAGVASVIPSQPLQSTAVPVNKASSVVGPTAPMQSMPASSDNPGHTLSGDAHDTIRIPITENLFRPERAGSAAHAKPIQGLTIPAAATSTEHMQAAGGIARMLTQPKVLDQSPVFTPKAAAGTTSSPELISHAVTDAGRTIPTTPVSDSLIQPVKPDLAALQQFAAAMSTATVAGDQGSQAAAAAAVSGGIGGAVSQTGSLLLQSSSPVNLNLEAPLGTKDWGEAVGERILWMVGRTIQGATLRVTPPHLGAIDIQLTMHQDQTSVSFSAQNGAVREALEAAIPRLREMFGESNLQLANVDVSQRQAEDQRGIFSNDGRNKGNGSEMGENTQQGMADEGNEPQSPSHLTDPDTDRLLDHYA